MYRHCGLVVMETVITRCQSVYVDFTHGPEALRYNCRSTRGVSVAYGPTANGKTYKLGEEGGVSNSTNDLR